MNKYTYKVRFVTLNFFIATTRTKLLHNYELIFWQQQQFQQQKKLIANKYFECFMSILIKISFLNFGLLNFTGR